MAEEPKKISFGFSKINKKTPLVNKNVVKEEEQVQFIDSIDNKSIKLVHEEEVKPPPVIPMKVASSLRENMLETIRARRTRRENGEKNGEKEEPKENGEAKPLTLEEQAAKEIMDEIKNKENEETKINENLKVPLPSIGVVSEKEPTLDDYEEMPISDFGLAMLRGMGWEEKKGIGLNEKVVKPLEPPVRPKGMGLGADKMMAAKLSAKRTNDPDLVMKKNAFIKVTTGPYSEMYGKVEGFDDLPGRIIVKLALQNNTVSLSEFMVDLIHQSEYNQNAKVMNLAKFNEFSDIDKKPKFSDLVAKPKDEYRTHKSRPSPDSPERKPKKRRDRSETPERKHKKKHKHKSRSHRDRSRSPKKHKRRHRSRS